MARPVKLGEASRAYRARIDALGEYVRNVKMPTELRQKLLLYYELKFPGRVVLSEQTLLDDLTSPLRLRVMLHHSHEVLKSLRILQDVHLSRYVASVLQRQCFVDGDVVIHAGDVGRGMFFIKSGAVDVLAVSNSPRASENASRVSTILASPSD